MISLALGVVPALAGISTLMLLMPMQVCPGGRRGGGGVCVGGREPHAFCRPSRQAYISTLMLLVPMQVRPGRGEGAGTGVQGHRGGGEGTGRAAHDKRTVIRGYNFRHQAQESRSPLPRLWAFRLQWG